MGSLNPYFVGRYSTRLIKEVMDEHDIKGLNPYFVGRYSTRRIITMIYWQLLEVLILILLEDTLRDAKFELSTYFHPES